MALLTAAAVKFVVGALAAAALVYFWNHIRDYLLDNVVPKISEYFGETAATMIRNLIGWADDAIALTKQVLVRSWKLLKKTVVGAKIEYRKVNESTAQASTVTYLRNDEGGVVRQTKTETVPWHELPKDVRETMLKTGGKTGEVDVLDLIENKLQEKAAKKQPDVLDLMA